MADDDRMHDGTAPVDIDPVDAPVLDRGECPICGIPFADPGLFRDHLGEAHDLYDEEGATTTLWIPTFAVEPPTSSEPVIPEDSTVPPPAVQVPTPPRASAGLIAFVVLLILFGGGLVWFVQTNDGSDTAAETVRNQSVSTAGTAAPVDSGDSVFPPSPSDSAGQPATDGSSSGALGSRATSPSTGESSSGGVPATEPAPPATTAPPTTTPAPTFVAPSTTSARVDSCSRDHGQRVVTYSWVYVGGTGWAPLASYAAVGGGRYQDTVSLPANGNTPVTTVGVVEANGKRHDVALSPSLSASNC